jgi:GT2 family glycosyltransferase
VTAQPAPSGEAGPSGDAAPPAVSIVIPSWNGRGYLEECLPSLRAQTFTDFELVVVDNGSTDGTADYVRRTWPEARLLVHAGELGFCRAVNSGLDVARGELVVILNNDVVVEPAWLQELVACMERHPAAGFCSSKALSYDDPRRLDGAGAALAPSGWFYEVGHGMTDQGQYDAEREVCVATGVSLMLRRSVLQEIGGLDEEFGTGCEDVDLTLRAFLAGYRGWYAPRSVLRHHRSGTVSRQPVALVEQVQRNMELVWLKNFPAGLLLRGLPARLLFWIGSLAVHARTGQLRPFLRGKLAALRALPRLRTARQAARTRTPVPGAELARLMAPGSTRLGLQRFRTLVGRQPPRAPPGTP